MRALSTRGARVPLLLAGLLLGAGAAGLAGYLAGVLERPQPPDLSQPPAVSGNPTSGRFALEVFDSPRPVPIVDFAGADGHRLTLADFHGRVVLLDVWATWCAPCRKEMPALDRLEAKLGGANFIVIPLSIDRRGADAVKPFYRELHLDKLGIYIDRTAEVSSALALPGLPTTMLIDRNGREVARKLGGGDWDGPQMVALIRRYLPPRPGAPARGSGEAG